MQTSKWNWLNKWWWFKVVTICENLRLLLVESRDSTQLKLVCNRNQVSVSVSGTKPISSFGCGFGVEACFFVKTETLIFIELKATKVTWFKRQEVQIFKNGHHLLLSDVYDLVWQARCDHRSDFSIKLTLTKSSD